MDNAMSQSFDYPDLNNMGSEEFYKTYIGFMYYITHEEGLDRYMADLVIDDVMIIIFMKRRCYYNPKKGKFRNYLATMVRNASRSVKRRERRYISYHAEEMETICDARDNDLLTMASSFEDVDIHKLIAEGIKILRTQVRSQLMVDVFVMMVIDHERPVDIAKKMNVSADYVSLAKKRCLPRLGTILRELMKKEG